MGTTRGIPAGANRYVEVGALGRQLFAGSMFPISEKYRTRFGKGDVMERIDMSIQQANTGLMLYITDLGRETMELDGHVNTLAQKRFGALAELEWTLSPASGPGIDPKLAKEICDVISMHLKACAGFKQGLYDLAWGVFDGRSLLEIDWQFTGGRYPNIPASIEWVHPRRLAFGPHRELCVIDTFRAGISWWTYNGVPIDNLPGKFIKWTPRYFNDYQEREGLLRRSLYWMYFKRFNWRERMIFTELFGKPLRVVEWEKPLDGAPPINKETYTKAAQEAESLGGSVTASMPQGAHLEVLWPGGESGPAALYTQGSSEVNSEMSRLWVGNEATTVMMPSGMGSTSATVQQQEQNIFLERDAGGISERIQHDLVRVDLILNWGPSFLDHCPTFQLRAKDEVDRTAEQQRLNAAITIGVPVKVAQYADRTGIEIPNEDEKIIVLGDGGRARIVDQKAERAAAQASGRDLALEVGSVALTPTDMAAVVRVNEARAGQGLAPLLLPDGSPDPDGLLPVSAYRSKWDAKFQAPGGGFGGGGGGGDGGEDQGGKPPEGGGPSRGGSGGGGGGPAPRPPRASAPSPPKPKPPQLARGPAPLQLGFDPGEARDAHGEWTADGGGADAPKTRDVIRAEKRTLGLRKRADKSAATATEASRLADEAANASAVAHAEAQAAEKSHKDAKDAHDDAHRNVDDSRDEVERTKGQLAEATATHEAATRGHEAAEAKRADAEKVATEARARAEATGEREHANLADAADEAHEAARDEAEEAAQNHVDATDELDTARGEHVDAVGEHEAAKRALETAKAAVGPAKVAMVAAKRVAEAASDRARALDYKADEKRGDADEAENDAADAAHTLSLEQDHARLERLPAAEYARHVHERAVQAEQDHAAAEQRQESARSTRDAADHAAGSHLSGPLPRDGEVDAHRERQRALDTAHEAARTAYEAADRATWRALTGRNFWRDKRDALEGDEDPARLDRAHGPTPVLLGVETEARDAGGRWTAGSENGYKTIGDAAHVERAAGLQREADNAAILAEGPRQAHEAAAKKSAAAATRHNEAKARLDGLEAKYDQESSEAERRSDHLEQAAQEAEKYRDELPDDAPDQDRNAADEDAEEARRLADEGADEGTAERHAQEIEQAEEAVEATRERAEAAADRATDRRRPYEVTAARAARAAEHAQIARLPEQQYAEALHERAAASSKAFAQASGQARSAAADAQRRDKYADDSFRVSTAAREDLGNAVSGGSTSGEEIGHLRDMASAASERYADDAARAHAATAAAAEAAHKRDLAAEARLYWHAAKDAASHGDRLDMWQTQHGTAEKDLAKRNAHKDELAQLRIENRARRGNRTGQLERDAGGALALTQPRREDAPGATLVAAATRAGAKVTGGWAQALCAAAAGPGDRKRALTRAANKLPLTPFAALVEHAIIRGAMLGAIHAHEEALQPATATAARARRPLLLDGDLDDLDLDDVDVDEDDPEPRGIASKVLSYAAQVAAFLARKILPASVFEGLRQVAKRRAQAIAEEAREQMLDLAVDEVEALDEGDGDLDSGELRDALEDRFDDAGWTADSDSRAELIFATAVQVAYQQGRAAQMDQPEVLAERPYRLIHGVDDSETRPAHLAAHGRVLRADDPFWQTAPLPWGFGCRCSSRSISEAGLESLGLTVTDGSMLTGLPDPGWLERGRDGANGLLLSFNPDQARDADGRWSSDEAEAAADQVDHAAKAVDKARTKAEKLEGPAREARAAADAAREAFGSHLAARGYHDPTDESEPWDNEDESKEWKKEADRLGRERDKLSAKADKAEDKHASAREAHELAKADHANAQTALERRVALDQFKAANADDPKAIRIANLKERRDAAHAAYESAQAAALRASEQHAAALKDPKSSVQRLDDRSNAAEDAATRVANAREERDHAEKRLYEVMKSARTGSATAARKEADELSAKADALEPAADAAIAHHEAAQAHAEAHAEAWSAKGAPLEAAAAGAEIEHTEAKAQRDTNQSLADHPERWRFVIPPEEMAARSAAASLRLPALREAVQRTEAAHGRAEEAAEMAREAHRQGRVDELETHAAAHRDLVVNHYNDAAERANRAASWADRLERRDRNADATVRTANVAARKDPQGERAQRVAERKAERSTPEAHQRAAERHWAVAEEAHDKASDALGAAERGPQGATSPAVYRAQQQEIAAGHLKEAQRNERIAAWHETAMGDGPEVRRAMAEHHEAAAQERRTRAGEARAEAAQHTDDPKQMEFGTYNTDGMHDARHHDARAAARDELAAYHRKAASGAALARDGGGPPLLLAAGRPLAGAVMDYGGIQVRIDRPVGYVQRGVGGDGEPWMRTYTVPYGEILGTEGGDGDPLDVFCGPDPEAPNAFWAEQVKADGGFDEFKLGLGWASQGDFLAAYRAHIPARFLRRVWSQPVSTVQALLGVSPQVRAERLRRRSVMLDAALDQLDALYAGDGDYSSALLFGFDPNEPRDEKTGEWSADGGGAGSAAKDGLGRSRAAGVARGLSRLAENATSKARAPEGHDAAAQAHRAAADQHRAAAAASRSERFRDAHGRAARLHDVTAQTHETLATMGRVAAEPTAPTNIEGVEHLRAFGAAPGEVAGRNPIFTGKAGGKDVFAKPSSDHFDAKSAVTLHEGVTSTAREIGAEHLVMPAQLHGGAFVTESAGAGFSTAKSNPEACRNVSEHDKLAGALIDHLHANADRNLTNVLVHSDGRMVLIDHDACHARGGAVSVFLHSDHALMPKMSEQKSVTDLPPKMQQYVRDLAASTDSQVAHKYNLDPSKAAAMRRRATTVVERGLAASVRVHDHLLSV